MCVECDKFLRFAVRLDAKTTLGDVQAAGTCGPVMTHLKLQRDKVTLRVYSHKGPRIHHSGVTLQFLSTS
eukprot:g46589.t1